MNNNIFREYDIRGVVKDDLDRETVNLIGKSFGTYMIRNGLDSVGVSGDVRETTPRLITDLVEGLLSTGVSVVKLGQLPTPANYFSLYHLDIDSSIQVTGSHNPPAFNGFKISIKDGVFYGKKIKELKEIILKNDFSLGEGSVDSIDILNDYVDMVTGKFDFITKKSVCFDSANAAGCLVFPKLSLKIGGSSHELYCDVDPSFPNHHPDPTKDENLEDIISFVKEKSLDMGIAFDGDADRIVAIDELGRIIRSDILMAIFVKSLSGKISKGSPIVYDVKCSNALKETIEQSGFKPVMWKTGHSLIKEKMKSVGAVFGGEMSGHLFFADSYYGYDDAIYASLRLIELLDSSDKKLSELFDEIPNYHSTPEIRSKCNDDTKFDIVDKCAKYFSDKYDCDTIDGIRINFEHGWGLVRASNTEPVIVSRFEAKSKELLSSYKSLVSDKINFFSHEYAE